MLISVRDWIHSWASVQLESLSELVLSIPGSSVGQALLLTFHIRTLEARGPGGGGEGSGCNDQPSRPCVWSSCSDEPLLYRPGRYWCLFGPRLCANRFVVPGCVYMNSLNLLTRLQGGLRENLGSGVFFVFMGYRYSHTLSLPIRIIKSRRMRWAGHVARMGEKRNAYRLLVRSLRWPRRRSVDNIKLDLVEVGWSDVDWIGLAQDLGQVESSCGYEPSDSIKCWETMKWLHNWWPFD
jgi:hypothetical protein